jgi:hypothetical protein
MRTLSIIQNITLRAQTACIPVSKLCAEAEVNVATFNRWKAGSVSPTGKKLDAVLDALSKLEAA